MDRHLEAKGGPSAAVQVQSSDDGSSNKPSHQRQRVVRLVEETTTMFSAPPVSNDVDSSGKHATTSGASPVRHMSSSVRSASTTTVGSAGVMERSTRQPLSDNDSFGDRNDSSASMLFGGGGPELESYYESVQWPEHEGLECAFKVDWAEVFEEVREPAVDSPHAILPRSSFSDLLQHTTTSRAEVDDREELESLSATLRVREREAENTTSTATATLRTGVYSSTQAPRQNTFAASMRKKQERESAAAVAMIGLHDRYEKEAIAYTKKLIDGVRALPACSDDIPPPPLSTSRPPCDQDEGSATAAAKLRVADIVRTELLKKLSAAAASSSEGGGSANNGDALMLPSMTTNVTISPAAQLLGTTKLSQVMNQLTFLNLSGNHIGDDGVEVLCQAVRFGPLRRVECLELFFNQIGPESVRTFAKYLLAKPPEVLFRSMEDHQDALDVSEDRRLIDFMVPLRHQRRPRRHRGTDNTAANSRKLSTLSCGDDETSPLRDFVGIGGEDDGTAKAFGASDSDYEELAQIDFDAPPPLDDRTNAATAVQALRLGYNDLGDEGADLLAVFLTHQNFLTDVSLAGNEVTNVGAAKLRDALRQTTSVTHVDLRGNTGILPSILEAIRAVLQFNVRQTMLQKSESVFF